MTELDLEALERDVSAAPEAYDYRNDEVRALLARLRAAEAERDRYARLHSEAEASAVLHPTGFCTCGGEGRCGWCLFDAMRERAEQAERERDEARAAALEAVREQASRATLAEARVRELEATVQGMALRESDLKEELTAENAALRAVAEAAREALDGWDSRRFVLYCTEKLRARLAALPGGGK